MKATSQPPAPYLVTAATPIEDEIIRNALEILSKRMAGGPVFDSPRTVKDFLCLKLATNAREVFAVVFCDASNRVIAYEELFFGTLTQTSVYPREIVKRALQLNAASVILSHNHPSGLAEPSRSDEFLTQTLKTALSLVDVKVLDHIIVACGGTTSFAERGLL